MHLHLASMAQFAAVNAAYCAVVPQAGAPARACVQLPLSRPLVATIEVLLATSAPAVAQRRTLHVQSVSRWAPACIGPYSQATECAGLVSIAGQVPLDSPTMQARAAALRPGCLQIAGAWPRMSSCTVREQRLIKDECSADDLLGSQAHAALQVLPPTEQLAECHRHCAAVAAALRCDLATSLLAATVFHTESLPCDSPAEHLLRLCSASAGTPQPTAAGEEGSDADTDSHDGAVRDSYLQTRLLELDSPVQPLCLAVRVPALPKGCCVEMQPLCALPPAGSTHAADVDSSAEGAADAFATMSYATDIFVQPVEVEQ